MLAFGFRFSAGQLRPHRISKGGAQAALLVLNIGVLEVCSIDCVKVNLMAKCVERTGIPRYFAHLTHTGFVLDECSPIGQSSIKG